MNRYGRSFKVKYSICLRFILIISIMISIIGSFSFRRELNSESKNVIHEAHDSSAATNSTIVADLFINNEEVVINGIKYISVNYIEEWLEDHELARSSSSIIINTCICTFLVIFAGLMSGLTVGYLSIDELVLELKTIGGTDEEKETAAIIQQVLSSKHRLLVTLLVSNAAAMEALPIFLGKLVPEWAAIIVSTTLVLFIGEVIPQAICTGPRQLEIARAVSPMTNWLIWVLSPLNIPLAWVLDYLLGTHSRNRFMNTDLRTLIELHTYSSLKKLNLLQNEENKVQLEKARDKPAVTGDKKSKDIQLSDIGSITESQEELSMSLSKPVDLPRKKVVKEMEEPSSIMTTSHELLQGDLGLNEEQANLMISAIEMKEKKAIEVMIPISKTFMISYDDSIDNVKLSVILERGFSRIPVYSGSNPNDIIGLVRIKQLIGIDLSEKKSMRQYGIVLRKPLIIPPKLNLLDLLREFKKGKSHMAFITEQVKELQKKFGNQEMKFKKGKADDPLSKEEIKIMGIVTLEDVIEKMINIQIYDEDDYEEMNKAKYSTNNVLKSKLL